MHRGRERLGIEERAERIRNYVTGVLVRRNGLPTVSEVIRAVGGSATVVSEVLNEYRTPRRATAEERVLLPFEESDTEGVISRIAAIDKRLRGAL